MAKFIGQFVSYFLNDIIVKTLANNKTFQRGVLKVDKVLTKADKAADDIAAEALKKGETVFKQKAAAAAAGEQVGEEATKRAVNRGGGGGGFHYNRFFKHFQNEVAKSFGGGVQKIGK